ncbi:MAG: hypothetical protein LBH07_06535 [Treponema sp.]|jgi:hypothetical protein|nr:hypothetical protein [Treponema sp.]
MAKKKANIGDLIKSDMSRRTIGEETETADTPPLWSEDEKKPPTAAAEKKPQAAKAAKPNIPDSVPTIKGITGLADFIAKQAQSAGLTEVTDLQNYYDYLQNQALRYVRGFNAGRRFYG